MRFGFSHKTYRLPLPAPLRTAHGRWTEREGIMVRLEDEAGRVGYGEIAPIPWFGTETLAEAAEICLKFGDKAEGALLDEVPERFGCVRFALAQARAALGQCDIDDTGGKRLPVAALLPAGREAVALLRSKLAGGFLAFKWKVGVGDPADELGVLDDLLAHLPAHAKLRLDANGAWTRLLAERWLARCAERPIEFVEQPVAPAEEDTLRGLAADYPVKLALDESVVRLAEARRWQAQGWPGIFVIKPVLAGPLDELARWISDTKADVVLSSAIETALGRAAVLRAALSQPLTKRALGFGVGEIFGDRRWDGPVIGPLADASCLADNSGEEMWRNLKPET
ncbi:MAG: o-succinylbenzoate synthase [Lacunisphaera sp.]|nr:o-succinylbenzoate synthase [Lacunisphaera sp.]